MKTTFNKIFSCLIVAITLLVLPVALEGQGQLQPRRTNPTRGVQQQNNQTGQLRPRNQTQTNPQFRNQQQNGGNTRPATTNRIVQPIKPVRPFPQLDQEHQQSVDQLLTDWEQRSAQIKRYEFTFKRWIYMPQFCNWRDPINRRLAACTLARGKVRYLAPDKGMYEVVRAWRFDGVENVIDPKTKKPMMDPKTGKPFQKAKYKEIRDEKNNPEMERWICDGNSIYEYDFGQKRIYETKLPAEMRGQGLKNSPLPFLFGAKVADIKQRYWVRAQKSTDRDKCILQAYPKRVNDARNYKRIDLVLSRDPLLPLSLTMYAPNFDAKKNQSYTVFTFEGRKVDGALSQIQHWTGNFVRPKEPFGWKMIERKPVSSRPPTQARQPLRNMQKK